MTKLFQRERERGMPQLNYVIYRHAYGIKKMKRKKKGTNLRRFSPIKFREWHSSDSEILNLDGFEHRIGKFLTREKGEREGEGFRGNLVINLEIGLNNQRRSVRIRWWGVLNFRALSAGGVRRWRWSRQREERQRESVT